MTFLQSYVPSKRMAISFVYPSVRAWCYCVGRQFISINT